MLHYHKKSLRGRMERNKHYCVGNITKEKVKGRNPELQARVHLEEK